MSSNPQKVITAMSLPVFVSSLLVCGFGRERFTGQASNKRPVTVEDVITMTRVANTEGSSSWQEGVPISSPDGKHVAIVLRTGDLEHNTNIYSLYVIESDTVFQDPAKHFLVSFSTSSNRPGINQVRWLDDNDTILFLAENPEELTQLYAIRYSTGKLRRLTNHPTNVTSYSSSAKTDRIVYCAEIPTRDLSTKDVARRGFDVFSTIDLAQLIQGHVLDNLGDACELFVRQEGIENDRILTISGKLLFPEPRLFLSPDGKYLVVKSLIRDVPPAWQEYHDPLLKKFVSKKLPKGSLALIYRYEVAEISTGNWRPLIDAPVGYSGSELMWVPDSHSIIVTGVHLPLDVTDQSKREARRASTFVAEISVENGEINEITSRELKLVGLQQGTHLWEFEARQRPTQSSESSQEVCYQKSRTGWETELDACQREAALTPRFYVDEDLNTPPRISGYLPNSKQKTVLFDLNPQFGSLSLAKVIDTSWTDSAGRQIRGALYLPPDYVPGKKYPLVIQTHGYKPHEFWMDGPYTTAFAAQPLASKGMVVLQLSQHALGTTEEGKQSMSAIDSALDYLDRQNLIDRDHVGLVGFSRTSYHVKYALTHSSFHFAAASVADGMDAGYFQYMLYAGDRDGAAEVEALIGAAPFGGGLSVWVRDSPGFLLNRVDTPVQIQAIGPASSLGEWEWFSGLSRLGKPVDLLYIPTGKHILEKPWDRLASQQATVDWFCFWLKGEEDPDPAKADQYARWRQLKRLQVENEKGTR